MNEQELNKLTDKELLALAKINKSTKLTDAFIIGFLIAIIIYSIITNSFSFLMAIPLFIVYKILNKPKKNETLEKILKNRNLK